jgi:hypothetical protein
VDKLAETGEIDVEMINHNGRSGLQLRLKTRQMTTGTMEDQTWKMTRGFHAWLHACMYLILAFFFVAGCSRKG